MGFTRLLTTSCVLLSCAFAHAQSPAKGRVLIREEFNSESVDQAHFKNRSWNIAHTWELREGALACILDPSQHPELGHGIPVMPKFKARNLRVSWRMRLDTPSSRLSLIPDAGSPARTGVPIWHIGDIVCRAPRNRNERGVSIAERDFTYDINDPRNVRKSHGPGNLFKPLGAYSVSGASGGAWAPVRVGEWHSFVFENVGTQWTVWVDGAEVFTMTLRHSDIDKESALFIGLGPLLLDNILIEELPDPRAAAPEGSSS
jgi:hypothetical protein